MNKTIIKSKWLLKNISLVLACVCVFSLCGCAGKADSKIEIDVGAPVAYPQSTDMQSHYCSPQVLKQIATSGLITLLFDESSSAVCVKVTSQNNSKLWSALPEHPQSETMSDEAEIVSLEIIHNSSRYFLNSQDCSVSNSSVSWDNTEEGFVVVYYITDNPSSIKNVAVGASDEEYSKAAGDNILFKITVNYTLRDGCLYASLNWLNLGNKDDILVNIGFLEYFGATDVAQEGDFLLVPDGSGAIINTFSNEPLDPVSVAVYGNDIGSDHTLNAVAPVYGVKNGNDAFAAIIEEGDALATINAAKAQNNSSYNHIGASFKITPSQIKNETEVFAENYYDGDITLCFRFLSGADATYAGLAAAAREQFIRNYTLSSTGVLSVDSMPVLVNVIGQAKKDGVLSFNKKLTTYSQAQDILNRIKSKGINNVYLRYSGALTGGIDAENAYDADFIRALGDSKDFRALNDYASGLNFNVFVDVSLISGSKSNFSVAGNLIGSKTSVLVDSIFTKTGFASEKNNVYLGKLSTVEKTVLSVLEKFTEYDSTGFCVTDVGSMLYTDFNDRLNRQSASELLNEKISPLATQNLVMVQNGNFYSLKNADIICDVPMSCKHIQSDVYVSVPFIQLVLHGIVEFSGQAINTSNDSKAGFLKCIEYGAIPSFVLTNNSLDSSEEYSKIYATDNWLTFMYNCYLQSSTVFENLRDSRITDHFKVAEGVYCTEYETTTKIYVNYTSESVVVGGITVEPMSFFRVN